MARTRYRKRRPRRVKRYRRSRTVYKRKSRRGFSRKRRVYRRRTGLRRRVKRRRGVSFVSGMENYPSKISVVRSLFRVGEGTSVLSPCNQTADSDYIKGDNPLGLLSVPVVPGIVETPDVCPNVGHLGCFIVFSLDTYLRAIVSSWTAYRYTYAVGTNDLGPRSYGIKGKMHPDELSFRRNMLDYARNNLFSISIRFIRRVSRTNNSHTYVPSYAINAAYTKGTATTSNPWTASTSGDTVNPAAPIPVNFTTGTFVAIGSNSIPWYSQTLDYFTSPFNFHKHLKNGAGGKEPDPITGTDDQAVAARVSRLLVEMGSGHREWKKHSSTGSLSFTLRKQKKSGDFLAVDPTPGAGYNTELKCTASYKVSKEVANSSAAVNSVENYISPRYERRVLTGTATAAANLVTLPSNNGPRGSILIWCPHSPVSLNTCYDIEVSGRYRFSGLGKSPVDLILDSENTEM